MTLSVAKIIQCQGQMNEWVWSIVRKILTGKINTLTEKPGPVPLSTKNPIRTGPQVNPSICGSVVRGPWLTVRAIYLLWEKWCKNAFHCIDQSGHVVLRVACVTNTGCVLFERLCNRNCHTAVLSASRQRMPNIAYPIFGLFSLISSMHNCWLRNSLSKLPKTVWSDGT